MRALGIEFEEIMIPLRQPETAARIKKYSPAGKVPILIDGERVIWESLAILHYLADRFPDFAIWPSAPRARAHAYAISAEMHAGFQALRQACPMNLIKEIAPQKFNNDVYDNVQRVEQIWRDARKNFGSGIGSDNPFLFGPFTAADAMFAPVVCRLHTYKIAVSDESRRYIDALLTFAPYCDWQASALKETWDIADYEVGHTIINDLRLNETAHL